MAMAARMPMIVITRRSSNRVKPACRRVRVMAWRSGSMSRSPGRVLGMAFSPAQLSGAARVRRRDADGRRVCGVQWRAALRLAGGRRATAALHEDHRRHPTVKESTPIQLAAYLDWLEGRHGLRFDDYESLHRWSVTELDAFWASVRDYFQLIDEGDPRPVLAEDRMPS